MREDDDMPKHMHDWEACPPAVAIVGMESIALHQRHKRIAIIDTNVEYMGYASMFAESVPHYVAGQCCVPLECCFCFFPL